MEHPASHSQPETSRDRLQRVRQAGRFLSWMFRGGKRRSPEAEPPTLTVEAPGEKSPWWSAWPEDRWKGLADARYPMRDPDHYTNYARYEPDDELHAVQSNADLAAWYERQRAITPPVSREERLAQIAASEPYTDHDFFRDPETGEVAIWRNTPDGLSTDIPVGPPILPRQPRVKPHPRPRRREFVLEPDTGIIYEQRPDGSRLDVVQFIGGSGTHVVVQPLLPPAGTTEN
jgi:hypothetical protein